MVTRASQPLSGPHLVEKWPLATGAGLAATLLAGCPGNLDHPERFMDASAVIDSAGPCPDIPELLRANCATVGCHESLTHAGNLDLISSNLEGRLRGRMASGGPGLLLDPGFPTESILYRKLTATPPFGARMPYGGAPLDEETLACIATWIGSQPPLPDMSFLPDLEEPPDLTNVDLVPGPDLAPRDLSVSRDLAPPPPDLRSPPDLAGRDLGVPPDLSAPRDLSATPDLSGPKDLSASGG